MRTESEMMALISTYVAKGLCRGELLYASDHLNDHVRPGLLRMLAWKAAIESGAPIATGKSYKYLPGFLAPEVWEKLRHTCRNDTPENVWRALSGCQDLFRTASIFISKTMSYPYPDYDGKVSAYLATLSKS